MADINYSTLTYFKVSVIGSAAVGKTSIISRLVNNYFPTIYEPTMDIEKFTSLFSLNEYEVKERTYVMVTLEDIFGLNNPLLQTPVELITSSVLREKRENLSNIFKDIMFTSMQKRDKLATESKKLRKEKKNKNLKYELYEENFTFKILNPKEEKIERRGYILVCDCSDYKSYEDINQIISKLHQIEKSNNLTYFYPKCVFINKHDKINDNEVKANLKKITQSLDVWKKKCNLEYHKVSALTNENMLEYFRRFLSKIHQIIMEDDQNDANSDNENEEMQSDPVMKIFNNLKINYLNFR
jgi:GTPase SAR1 family protein